MPTWLPRTQWPPQAAATHSQVPYTSIDILLVCFIAHSTVIASRFFMPAKNRNERSIVPLESQLSHVDRLDRIWGTGEVRRHAHRYQRRPHPVQVRSSTVQSIARANSQAELSPGHVEGRGVGTSAFQQQLRHHNNICRRSNDGDANNSPSTASGDDNAVRVQWQRGGSHAWGQSEGGSANNNKSAETDHGRGTVANTVHFTAPCGA